MSYIGIQERRIGSVSILDADSQIRIGLKFGASAVALSKAVQSLLDGGQDQILLNLEHVPSIDARGLAEIVSAAAAINQKGGRFKLFRLNETGRETMKKAQQLTYFEVFDVESRAIKSFTISPYLYGNQPRAADAAMKGPSMSHEKGWKSVFLQAGGVVVIAVLAVWQFYIFVTLKNAAGTLDVQDGRAHLWWAISLVVVAFIAAVLLLSASLQYDRNNEMYITSLPSRKSIS